MRDPIKIPRDLAQAKITALIARKYLNLAFDDSVLRSLPQRLRSHIPDV
jgi:hypothetical protein